MSEQPQVAPFVAEAQQLYLESLSNDELLTLSLRQNPATVQRKPFLPFIHAWIQDKEYTSLWPSKALCFLWVLHCGPLACKAMLTTTQWNQGKLEESLPVRVEAVAKSWLVTYETLLFKNGMSQVLMHVKADEQRIWHHSECSQHLLNYFLNYWL